MSEAAGERTGRAEAPSNLGSRLKLVGPGLIMAATGVGAGDMVSSLAAGTSFGMVLLWAILFGALIKFVLTEGLGRWYMATGETIIEGWRSLGRVASAYFGIYLILQTFAFGAAGPSASAIATTAMFPGVMPFWAWAALHSVVFGFALVIIGRYGLFERVMEVFVGLMFVTVVGLAIMLTPGLGELALGTVPRVPEGSLLNILAVIGGVGGTFTLASYTYWARERGWRQASWIPMMRTDLGVGYAMTAIFMVSMMVIGAEFLFGTARDISGEEGLVALSDPLGERFGDVAKWLFLIGFWSATTSSIVGAWNGGSHLFADWVRTIRRVPDEEAEIYLSEKGPYFRAFLFWMTFPPMILFFFGEPVLLVIIYASLGTLFFPFLAVTLLWLLNSQRVASEYRNRILANIILGASVLLFIVLGVQELLGLF